MRVKLFEILDRHTFIPAMGIHVFVDPPTAAADLFLLRRAGYSTEQILSHDAEPYIILSKLDNVEAHYDPYKWGDARTMKVAHLFIIKYWHTLNYGDVIDVEYILGETNLCKRSEMAF